MEIHPLSGAIMDIQPSRRSFSVYVDGRAIDGIRRAAKKSNLSLNRYMEELLMGHSKAVGEVPIDISPLARSWGGKREKKESPN